MKIKYTPSFIRSSKKFKRKNYPIEKVKECVHAIVLNKTEFLKKHKDHSLTNGLREMHIDRQYNDDWLLFYRFNKNTQELELELIDIGSHDQMKRIIKFKS